MSFVGAGPLARAGHLRALLPLPGDPPQPGPAQPPPAADDVSNGTQPSGAVPDERERNDDQHREAHPREVPDQQETGEEHMANSRKLTRLRVCSDGNRDHRQAPATPTLGLRFARTGARTAGVPRSRSRATPYRRTCVVNQARAAVRGLRPVGDPGAVDGGGERVAAGVGGERV